MRKLLSEIYFNLYCESNKNLLKPAVARLILYVDTLFDCSAQLAVNRVANSLLQLCVVYISDVSTNASIGFYVPNKNEYGQVQALAAEKRENFNPFACVCVCVCACVEAIFML